MEHKRIRTAMVEAMANIEKSEKRVVVMIEEREDKLEESDNPTERAMLQEEIDGLNEVAESIRYHRRGDEPSEADGGLY